MKHQKLKTEAIQLLKELIATKSISGHEEGTAQLINDYLQKKGIPTNRKVHNIWATNRYFNPELPVILLNSHHDTVKPNEGWTLDPFDPIVKDGKLFGLGSNDAGGALVSLIATFLNYYERDDLHFNLILAATAEEENSGENGIESILTDIGKIDLAIVGEPTEMKLAIAEKGLLVIDCIARGKSGHAARDVGENAILKAIKDIEWFQSYKFHGDSTLLGPVKMNVTMIEAGIQHNIIPDTCKFTVDIRSTDLYSNEDILAVIQDNISSDIYPRSTRLNASSIDKSHPIVTAAVRIGLDLFGSPTTSDQAVINAPSIKIGPGKSDRSHTADEFIFLEEIENGIDLYIELLANLKF